MNIYEINPFVRFAGEFVLLGTATKVFCCDSRLFYVLSGSAEVVVNNIVYKIDEDTAMLWKGGTVYRFKTQKPSVIIAINFDFTQDKRKVDRVISPIDINEFRENMVLENLKFEDNKELNKEIIIQNIPEIKGKIKLLAELFKKKEVYYGEKCSAKLKEIILDILRYTAFPSMSVLDKVEKVITYINDNYAHIVNNVEIANIVCYHPYHLNKLMIKYTGMTTHQYLLNYRLEKSKEFLINQTCSVAEIAEKCGFNSSYHFSNSFNNKYGCSPGKYRRANRNLL